MVSGQDMSGRQPWNGEQKGKKKKTENSPRKCLFQRVRMNYWRAVLKCHDSIQGDNLILLLVEFIIHFSLLPWHNTESYTSVLLYSCFLRNVCDFLCHNTSDRITSPIYRNIFPAILEWRALHPLFNHTRETYSDRNLNVMQKLFWLFLCNGWSWIPTFLTLVCEHKE